MSFSIRPTIYACGDCAGEIIAAGGRVDPSVREILMETLCQVHNGLRAATHAVIPSEGWTRPQVSHEATTLPELPDVERLGPLTEVSTRIFAAMIAGKPELADRLMMLSAVDVARQLLAETKGR